MKSKLPEGVIEVIAAYKQGLFDDGAIRECLKINPIYARLEKHQEKKSHDPSYRKTVTHDKAVERILAYDNVDLFEALFEIDALVKQYTPKDFDGQSFFDDHYLAQWEVFLRELIDALVMYSKENRSDAKKEFAKQRERLSQITTTANKLARLIKDAEELGVLYGYSPVGLHDPFNLLTKAAERMKSSEYMLEANAGWKYHGFTKICDRYLSSLEGPPTHLLVKEIANIASRSEIEFFPTSSRYLDQNHKYNIFIRAFFGNLLSAMNLGLLPSKLFALKDRHWATIFNVINNDDGITEKTVNTNKPKNPCL